jgi:hypothetical protein
MENSLKKMAPVIFIFSGAVIVAAGGLMINYYFNAQADAELELLRQEELAQRGNMRLKEADSGAEEVLFEVQDRENGKCAPFFSEPTGQNETIDLFIECKLAVGEGYNDWKISILGNQQADQQFEMEIFDGGGELVQKIPVGEIDFSSNDTAKIATSGDEINFAYDVNFDGYKDLRVLKILAASNIIYDYWIFDPVLKKFKKDPILAEVSNPSFDKNKKVIDSYIAAGADPANWTVLKYEFSGGSYKKTEVK